MRAYERLLRYIQFDTASDENSASCPSTSGQRVLGEALVEEMRSLGVEDARIDQDGYVYGSIPANAPGQDAIGLIAHMDTVNCVPSTPMNARIVENYDGGDIYLNDRGVKIEANLFPRLAACRGQDIIVTDGNTILGADDKAGVAEILTLCERLRDHPERKHGKIAIAFTPDEEIGRGADRFDVEGFGADYAYTVDGGELGGIECENFNAASCRVDVRGVSIHPGSAKDRMKNACLLAMQYNAMLPSAETPAHTEGYEGFYHLDGMRGNEERARLDYIVRDHDRQKFEARKARLLAIAEYLNGVYGAGAFEVSLKDSYYNMKEKLEGRMEIVERARQAMREAGVTPEITPIRGGTDGARLSFMGLLCPNLSTGGMNFHGRLECIPVQAMDKMVDVLENLVRAR